LLILIVLGQTKHQLECVHLANVFVRRKDSVIKVRRSFSFLRSPSTVASPRDDAMEHLFSHSNLTVTICNCLMSFFMQESVLLDAAATMLGDLCNVADEMHRSEQYNPSESLSVYSMRSLMMFTFRDAMQDDAVVVDVRALKSYLQGAIVNARIWCALQWMWESIGAVLEVNPGGFISDDNHSAKLIDKEAKRTNKLGGPSEQEPAVASTADKETAGDHIIVERIGIPHYRFLRMIPLLYHFTVIPVIPKALLSSASFNKVMVSANSNSRSRAGIYLQYQNDFCLELGKVVAFIESCRRVEFSSKSPCGAASSSASVEVNAADVAIDFSTDPVEPSGEAAAGVTRRNNDKHLEPYLLIAFINAAPRLGDLLKLRLLGSPGFVVTSQCVDAVIGLFPSYPVQTMIDFAKDARFIELLVSWLYQTAVSSSPASQYDIQATLLKEWDLVGTVLKQYSSLVSDPRAVVKLLSQYASHLYLYSGQDVRIVGWNDQTVHACLDKIITYSFNVRILLQYYRSPAADSVSATTSDGFSLESKKRDNRSTMSQVLYQLFRYWSDILFSLEVQSRQLYAHSGYAVVVLKGTFRDHTKEAYCTLCSTLLCLHENQGSCESGVAPFEVIHIASINSHFTSSLANTKGKFANLVIQTELDHNRKLFGFEIVAAGDASQRHQMYLTSEDSLRCWFAAIERALHAQTTNIINIRDESKSSRRNRSRSNSTNTRTLDLTKESSAGDILVAEEWYEYQTMTATVWSPIKPLRFYDRSNAMLPTPVFNAPVGWKWVPLTKHPDFPRGHKPNHFATKLLGPLARVFVDYPRSTDKYGWIHGTSPEEIIDDRLSCATKVSSTGRDGKKLKLRRRKWVRARSIDMSTGLNEMLHAHCSVNSYSVFQQTGILAASIGWNLTESPNLRDVLLTIVRLGIAKVLRTIENSSTAANSAVALGKSLLEIVLSCGDGDDWNIDIQTVLVEEVHGSYIRLNTPNYRRDCINYLCRRQLTSESSVQYQALFFSFFWIILRDELVELEPMLLTASPIYSANHSHFSNSNSNNSSSNAEYARANQIMGAVQHDRNLVSVLLEVKEYFELWARVMLWLFKEWEYFPSRWLSPTHQQFEQFGNAHIEHWIRNHIASSNTFDQDQFSDGNIQLVQHENNDWLLFLQEYLKQYRLDEDIPELAVPVLKAAPEYVAVKDVASEWWRCVDTISFKLAKEFMFEYFAIICGLRSPNELQTLRGRRGGPFDFETLNTVCLRLKPADNLPLEEIIARELKWQLDTRLQVDCLHRICNRFFQRDVRLQTLFGVLQQRLPQFPVRWIRCQLMHGFPAYCGPFQVFPKSDSWIPKEFVDAWKYLSIFDDWRYNCSVVVSGATGTHAATINGRYRLFQLNDTISVGPNQEPAYAFRCERENGIVELAYGKSHWEIRLHGFHFEGGANFAVPEAHGRAQVHATSSQSDVLARISIADLDNFGNESSHWFVNRQPLGVSPSFVAVQGMRVHSVVENRARGVVMDGPSFFHEIWTSSYCPDVSLQLATSIRGWKMYKALLDSPETPVLVIYNLLDSLGNHSEVILQFLRVLSMTTSVTDLPLSNELYSPDVSWVKQQNDRMKQMQYYSKLRTNLESLLSSKYLGEFLDGFLTEKVRLERTKLWATLALLRSRFTDDLEYHQLLLFQIPEEYARPLVELQPRFIDILSVGKELLEWMRDSPNIQSDEQFRLQEERIRGKDVTSLPEEIPDEAAVTTAIAELQVIRACFHEFLFSAKTYSSFASLMNTLLKFNQTKFQNNAGVINAVTNCCKIKAGLIELYEEDDDVTVPNRLLKYALPERHTRWVVGPNSVELVTLTARLEETRVSTQNLIDFQSKLNLSQSRTKDSNLENWIDAFNQQFKWTRLLQVTMNQLSDAGHPYFTNICYPWTLSFAAVNRNSSGASDSAQSQRERVLAWNAFETTDPPYEAHAITEEFPMIQMDVQKVRMTRSANVDTAVGRESIATGPDVLTPAVVPFPYSAIAQRCTNATADLVNWKTMLDGLMSKHYYFNYFSVHQIWTIISCLTLLSDTSFHLSPERGLDVECARGYLAGMFELYGFGAVIAGGRVEPVVKQWRYVQGQYEETTGTAFLLRLQDKNSWFEAMRIFGLWVDVVFQAATLRRRIIENRDIRRSCPYDHIENGLNIIVLPSEMNPVDVVMSLFAVHGCMPERENLVICEEAGSSVSAEMLINRWGYAHNHNRAKSLFVISLAERLSTEEQRSMTVQIQSRLNEASLHRAELAKLVIVVGGINRSTQYICESYVSCIRSQYTPLEHSHLVNTLKQLQDRYCRSVTVYRSRYPGQGKTFQIRRKALDANASIVKVPIHGQLTSRQFILQVYNVSKLIKQRAPKVVLHIEIGNAKHTADSVNSLLLELLLLDGILHVQSGCQLSLKASSHEFITCIEVSNWQIEEPLRLIELLPCLSCKLDAQSFQSSLFGLQGFGAGHDEAYSQLQVVCKTLQLLTTSSSKIRFPLQFHSLVMDMDDVDSFNAYQSLCIFFKIDESTSGHRLWSLVRIFHAQIQSLFHPDSYISATESVLLHDAPYFVYRVVEFLILTATDICQPARTTRNVGELIVRPWQEMNHEFICSQPSNGRHGGGLSFLSLQMGESLLAKKSDLKEYLEKNKMLDTTSFEKNFVGALNSILGTNRTQEQANSLLDGNNCITKDSVMKMIAIFIRLQNKVPVLLMGECG
jgi:hypothetical protein